MNPLKLLFVGDDKSKAAFASFNKSMVDSERQSRRTADALDRYNRVSDRTKNQLGRSEGFLVRNRRAFQQLGFQVGDFATQIAGGQSAILAFTQQGGQMLQFFGAAGAIAAALVAIFGSLWLAIDRSGASLSSFSNIAGDLIVLAGPLGSVLSGVKSLFFDMANFVVNQLDRIIVYAGVVVSFFAGRWVVGFAAASVGALSLAKALDVVKWAMARLPITALIVAVSEAIIFMLRLTRATGSFGQAFSLVGDLAYDVGVYIIDTFKSVYHSMLKVAYDVLAAFNNAFYGIAQGINVVLQAVSHIPGMEAFGSFGNGIENAMKATVDAAKNASAEHEASAQRLIDLLSDYPMPSLSLIKDYMSQLEDGTIDIRDLIGKIGEATDSVGSKSASAGKAAKAGADEAAEAYKKWFDAVKDVGKGIGDAVGDSILSVTKGTASVLDAVVSMVSGVLEQLYKVMVITPISNAVASAATNWISGSTGGIGSAIGSAVQSNINFSASSATGRASGGFVQAGRSYVVGEGGVAEQFTPSTNGVISKVNDGGDNININMVFNLSTGVAETVRREVAAAVPAIVSATKASILDAKMRGKKA